MLLVLAFGIGIVAGLRSMTPPAVVAWAARLGHLEFAPTPLGWLGSGIAAWIFAAAAVGELVGDKLPSTPNRTAVGPLIARLLSGALAGSALAAGHAGSLPGGAVAGALGALVGAFGGYRARTGLVRALGTPDYVVALLEDVVAVGGAILLVLAAG
jgi:uncharacterized membrane protein